MAASPSGILRRRRGAAAEVKADLKGLNLTAETLLGQVGLKARPAKKDRMLIEQIATRPTAEINGVIGGYTGEGAKTVIPRQGGSAKVSFRLVGQQDPKKIREAFRAFVKARLPVDCTVEFANFADFPGHPATVRNPSLDKARAALQAEWGRKTTS